MKITSREAWEQDRKHQYDDDFPKGISDTDFYQNPDEPISVRVVKGKLIEDVRPANVIFAEALADRPF